MIILERSISIVFSIHLLSSLKKHILHDLGKVYTCLDWCWINWQNYQKSCRLSSMKKEVLFHFSRSTGCIEIFISYKKTGNLWRKKAFHKTFHFMQKYVELHCLVDDLVIFLYLSIFINVFFTNTIWWSGWGTWALKKHFDRYHLYIFFFKLLPMT